MFGACKLSTSVKKYAMVDNVVRRVIFFRTLSRHAWAATVSVHD
jgi:hypothetical protein